MLVAKSDEAHWRVARQFENRTIQKTYMAVIHGVPELLADVIDMPIGQDRYVREKQAVRKVENGGREAVTRYEVQEVFQAPAEAVLKESNFVADRRCPCTAGAIRVGQAYSQDRTDSPIARTHGRASATPSSAIRCTEGASFTTAISAWSGKHCMRSSLRSSILQHSNA